MEMCDKRRFPDAYMENSQLRQRDMYSHMDDVQVGTCSNRKKKKLSTHQKFRKAAGIASKLAGMPS